MELQSERVMPSSESSAAPYTLEQIKLIIEARVTYFFDLLKYVKKILNEKISEEEIEEFLTEVLDFGLKSSDPMRNFLFNALEIKLTEKIKTYNILLQALSNGPNNKEQDICYLNVLLSILMNKSNNSKKVTTNKNITKEIKITYVLHDYEWLEELHSYLSYHLPLVNNELEKYVDYRDPHISHKKGKAIIKIPAGQIAWDKLLSDLSRQCSEAFRKSNVVRDKDKKNIVSETINQRKNFNKEIKGKTQEERLKSTLSQTEVKFLSQNEKEQSYTNDIYIIQTKVLKKTLDNNKFLNDLRTGTATWTQLSQYLRENINLFFEIYPNLVLYRASLNALQENSKLTKEAANTQKLYDNIKSNIESEIKELELDKKSLEEKCNYFLTHNLSTSSEFKAIENLLSKISTTEITALREEWVSEEQFLLQSNDKNIMTENEINDYIERFRSNKVSQTEMNSLSEKYKTEQAEKLTPSQQKDEILKRAKATRGKLKILSNFLNNARIISNDLSLKLKLERKPSNQAQMLKEQHKRDEIEKEREEFYSRKEEELRKHKENAEQKKNERLALKKQPTIIVSEPMQDTTHVYKNIDFEKILQDLSTKNLELIFSILTLKKGIKYDDVYTLITSQLGGKIKEIGNGSSHKRIELSCYYLEIITHSDTKLELIVNNSKAVGGFFKPHGHGHDSGVLSRFNLSLICKVFHKAKITLSLVEMLLKKKLESSIDESHRDNHELVSTYRNIRKI